MEGYDAATGGNKDEKIKASQQLSSLASIKFWVVVLSIMALSCIGAMQMATLDNKVMVPTSAIYFPYSFPPQRVYKNNGYLIGTPDGGLNQKRLAICDMVVIARYLNVTLIVPKNVYDTYWNDTSTFEDIFDVNHFITSLRDEVRILKELPPKQKMKAETEPIYHLFPMSFASLAYYDERVLPRFQKQEILLFGKTHARLANNGITEELQRLRCRVNYEALRFTQPIEKTGRKLVTIFREKGPFVVPHLKYEKDMLAFTGRMEGLTKKEAADLTSMRYSREGWKHKPIDANNRRKRGLCPLTPENTALLLQALGIHKNTTIYMAAGQIYNSEKRLADLVAAYPNLVTKQTILTPEELQLFMEDADQMAASDYIVAVESDVYLPTFEGNMAKAVEGHRTYLGFKTTIYPERKILVNLIDDYRNGTLSWDEFSLLVKKSQEERTGKPAKRIEIPEHPRQEDYFYSNPQECLQPLAQHFNSPVF